jgi:hypothetical protein
MLTILDRATGALVPITAAAGDLLRVAVMVPAGRETPSWAARVLVIGDLLNRILEDFHGTQVLLAVIAGDCDIEPLISDLAVRPPAGIFATLAQAQTDLGARLDIAVTSGYAEARSTTESGAIVAVESVTARQSFQGLDPVTLRMALLTTRYSVPLHLSRGLVASCQPTLDRWRHRLAEWSRHPSHPIPPVWRAHLRSAVDDDLDAHRAMSLMADLENSKDVAPGAKFEAFAYADRVLALDLMREMGRTRC